MIINTKNKGVQKKSNVIKFEPKIPPEYVEWPMSKQILVGKRSDGYQILQALVPLFEKGYWLHVSAGEKGQIIVTLFNKKNNNEGSAEGSSFSVALRRMTVGFSKKFSHMSE